MKIILKVLLSSAILYWLISAGKIDFSLIIKIFKHPPNLIGSMLLLLIQVFICAYRWRVLLKIKSPSFTFMKVLSIQWVGLFFSAVLPGAVAGDFIKISYAQDSDKNFSKKFLFFTIFLDRVVGLSALLCVSGIASLFFYDELDAISPSFKNIIFINTILFLGSLIFLSLFYLKQSWQKKMTSLIPTKKLKELLDSLWSVSNHKKEISFIFLISLPSHLISIAAFWLINQHFFEGAITAQHLLTMIPIGQIAVAIPISPGGLGVGHMAYERLFGFIQQSNGASLFNLFWMAIFFINILGVIPYIFQKSQTTKANLVTRKA